MQLHTGLFERQYSVAQSTAARFRELGSPRERTGGLDEAAERQRHMHGSHEERGVRALMKKRVSTRPICQEIGSHEEEESEL